MDEQKEKIKVDCGSLDEGQRSSRLIVIGIDENRFIRQRLLDSFLKGVEIKMTII